MYTTQLELFASAVRYGLRPCAEITIDKRDFRDFGTIDAITTHHGILYYTHAKSDYQLQIFLYKHPHMLNVIKYILKLETASSDPVVHAWLTGKAFGFSEEAIAEVIREDFSNAICSDNYGERCGNPWTREKEQ